MARAALHHWEEPPISGTRGSGTVFFAHCPLRCSYCQNASISREGFGRAISVDRLAQIFAKLQAAGAHNLNLVTATHYAPQVLAALQHWRAAQPSHASQRNPIPVIINSSGYETPDSIRMLAPHVDAWLVDWKYADGDLAAALSVAPDYPSVARRAIALMVETAGPYRIDAVTGLLQSGVVIRHLLLPGHLADACAIVEEVITCYGDRVCLSLMSQYTPPAPAPEQRDRARKTARGDVLPPEMLKTVEADEYDALVNYAVDLGVAHSFMQEGTAASESFIPPFDLTGVTG
ncbi:MAG: radical SAM protein [Actinomycetes bacterium]|nr:radical SAM protein [Actinomycetes bacterium]